MELSRNARLVVSAQHIRALVAVNMAILVCAVSTAEARRRKPVVIQIYNGFGTPKAARVWGRVLEDKGLPAPKAKESWYSKLKRNYHALESDEIPEAQLEIRVLGRRQPVKADKEGLFEVKIKGPIREGKHPVTARFIADDDGKKRRFRVVGGKLLVWPAKPGVAVISDIDDTVLETGVGSKLRMAKRVMTTNARDLKTFTGAPALYRVWSARGYPLVFVSGSPVNLYLKLTRFLALKRFPRAPLMLKDFGFKDLTKQKAYKLAHIATAAQLLPGYRFILVGDDGEQDPEIYKEVERRYKGRVEVVLIHKVSKKPKPAPKGQLHFDDFRKVAAALHKRRLLSAAELKKVGGRP
jgi:phosphatidate phosphatase APP1